MHSNLNTIADSVVSTSQESESSDAPSTVGQILEKYLDSKAMLDHRDIQYGRKIGSGSTAEVFMGTWNGHAVAIKRIMKSFQRMSVREARELTRELAILQSVSHPSLVHFHGVLPIEPVEILTDYCAGGTCFSLFHEGTQDDDDEEDEVELSWTQVHKILMDTAQGMHYLHGLTPMIIHRDLKSLNMLLVEVVKDNRQIPSVKLCDFGIARLKDDGAQQMTKDVGTYNWIAPEVLNNEKYDEKVDIYSFGMVVFEGASGEIPFEDEEDGWEIIRRVKNGDRPDTGALPPDCPPELSTLMGACWAEDPTERPDFQKVLDELTKLKDRIT